MSWTSPHVLVSGCMSTVSRDKHCKTSQCRSLQRHNLPSALAGLAWERPNDGSDGPIDDTWEPGCLANGCLVSACTRAGQVFLGRLHWGPTRGDTHNRRTFRARRPQTPHRPKAADIADRARSVCGTSGLPLDPTERSVVLVGHTNDHAVVVERVAMLRRGRGRDDGHGPAVILEIEHGQSDSVEAHL